MEKKSLKFSIQLHFNSYENSQLTPMRIVSQGPRETVSTGEGVSGLIYTSFFKIYYFLVTDIESSFFHITFIFYMSEFLQQIQINGVCIKRLNWF